MEQKLKAMARVLEVMDTLREQCPWDREQTFASLRNNTIEEAFELTDAITDGDMEGIKEELGDLLLHVIFYSKLGEEEGKFNFADVADAECDKLIYRHPHVYGDIHADTPEEVKQNWEALNVEDNHTQFLLDQYDGKELACKTLFSKFDRFAQGFLQRFLRNLYIALWSLLFIIPGIIKPNITAKIISQPPPPAVYGHPRAEKTELSLFFV